MASWKFKRRGEVSGPFSEKEIRNFLLRNPLVEGDVVQSDESPWRDANIVRKMFRDLIEFGWYVQHNNRVLGPFTPSRILDMRGEALITKNTLVRQGPTSPWAKFADAHDRHLRCQVPNWRHRQYCDFCKGSWLRLVRYLISKLSLMSDEPTWGGRAIGK